LAKRNFSANEILKEINSISQLFSESRKYYPYIDDKFIGKKPTLEFHLIDTKIFLNFAKPIKKEFQNENNKIAHFLNQNFLLRLYSVLDEYKIFRHINKDNNPELYVLKRLRNIFSHSLGKFDNNKPDHRNLMRHIIKTFHLENIKYDDFPISIDKVISKILSSSKQYIKDNFY